MVKHWVLRCASLVLTGLLCACALPVVTPQIATPTVTEEAIFSIISETPSSDVTPISAPVEITARNAAALVDVNRAAVNTMQQLRWALDNQSLDVATQTSDAAGNPLFGVSILAIPDLTPIHIFSIKDGRVADISQDGRTAALISLDMQSVSLIDLTDGNDIRLTITPDYLINNASFSPDGTRLALTQADQWEVDLYSTKDGSLLKQLTGFETAAPVFNAGFMNAPQWIVWHARATLQLQEIESGTLGPILSHEDFVTDYALSPDGSILASAASKMGATEPVPTITLWDAAQGIPLRDLQLEAPALCLAFSPKGNLLAVGVGSSLEVWDVPNGKRVAKLDAHAGEIIHVAFSADEKYIATAGNDNQLYLWQVSE